METISNADTLEETIGIEVQPQFITSNTVDSSLQELKTKHIIPVYSRDNETLISHSDFIESVQLIAQGIFKNEGILEPLVKLSHPVKGRIPEARKKPANELLETEKTLYYERMAFMLEIPTLKAEVEGNLLSLTVGGVKAFNLDNMNSKKGVDQHFKVFIGFKNSVCTNLCISTDGYSDSMKVRSLSELFDKIHNLFNSFNADKHLSSLGMLGKYQLQERQFAQLLGRARMYQYLPSSIKRQIAELKLSDTQINAVAQGFYRDRSFSSRTDGSINMWNMYNLLTGANKTSYIDSFLDKGVNSFQFVQSVCSAMESKSTHWFLN